MIRRILSTVIVVIICSSYGPPNCNLYKDDKECYEACIEAEKAVMHGQGSKASQEHFDKSIQHCPSFDYSYYEKAVPYAKRGLMREWKIMIDKAVELDPKEHLSNRGWYHFFFMHNYEAAIKDIERLDEMLDYDIGTTGDGTYHLNVMKALCWKGLGERQKAIEILTAQLNNKNHDAGLYDYLHLGVLYLENKEYELALQNLDNQIEVNDLSEIYYYKAMCLKQLNKVDEYKANLKKSLEYYEKDKSMSDPYRQLIDEIYRSDIENEMAIAMNNYKAGLIMPTTNDGTLKDICCIYSPKNGFKVYDNPNGNLIGKIFRNSESENIQESQYSIYFLSNTKEETTRIDLNDLAEVSYEIWSINFFDKKDGFVRIINNNYNFWLSEQEIKSSGFGFTTWQNFIIENNGILLGFYANVSGLKLMSEPRLNSNILKEIKGHTFSISPFSESKDNWTKVKVTKTKEHPCETDLLKDENFEYEIEGWMEIVDSDGSPNVWYYPRGC